MIDWYNLAANSFWIAGLALALSILSLARCEALAQRARLIDVLATNRWQSSLNVAGILFCGGLAATSEELWKQILWLVLLSLLAIQLWGMIIFRRNPSFK